ncbi:MAG: long-chain fatty acid--CoA ligase, partial [Solirubrobacteraceae bacterium]
NHSEAKFCFVATKELYSIIHSIKELLPNLVGIYTFEEVEDAPNWNEILSLGEDDSTQYEVDVVKDLINPDSVLTIIYTSGTTGVPKGVVLTHNNIVSNVLATNNAFPKFSELGVENPVALSFLPINHIFERVCIYWNIYRNVSVYYAESIEKISDNLAEVKPHVMTAVPRLLEKVYNKIIKKGESAGGIKTKLFMSAVNMVKDLEPFTQDEKGFLFKLKYAFLNKLIFSKWAEALGGNLAVIICGSAALSPKLVKIFYGAGIPIAEGYGLTETSPVISLNTPKKEGFCLGSVGKILDNLDVKIAEDGEIILKGPSVFSEYFKDPINTKEAFNEQGYFKTGDIGVIDSNGFLKITDRKKSMFKTSGGKYIAPQIIENEMKLIPFVEQVIVVGDGEKMACAIVQPNFDNIKDWASVNEKNIFNEEQIANSLEVKEIILKDLEKVNANLGSWEKIKDIQLTPIAWTIENDLLTPTMKVKRKNVMDKFSDLYKKLYPDTI